MSSACNYGISANCSRNGISIKGHLVSIDDGKVAIQFHKQVVVRNREHQYLSAQVGHAGLVSSSTELYDRNYSHAAALDVLAICRAAPLVTAFGLAKQEWKVKVIRE